MSARASWRLARAWTAAVAVALAAATAAGGERRPPAAPTVVSVASGGERIPTIRTGRGVTTMLSMPEEAREAVCGDLYDSQSGNGGFVIQRSGRDLFLKPLRAAGATNLFVKTERATYAFELVVVAPARAMRIVRVEPAPADRGDAERERLARDRAALERDAARRAEALAREWVAASVRQGAAVTPVTRRATRGRAVDVELGAALFTIGGRGYLLCGIRNRSRVPVIVASAELDGERGRTTLNEVIAPGGTSTVVLECAGDAPRDTLLRLLDPAGSELVAVRPFR